MHNFFTQNTLKYYCDECLINIGKAKNYNKAGASDADVKIKHGNRLAEIVKQIEELKKRVTSQTYNEERITYANIAKRAQETILIKPKVGLDFSFNSTKNIIKTKINPTELDVGIRKMENVADEGVVISCGSKEEQEKLKLAVESKIGADFSVQVISKSKPMIKIIGIEEEMTKQEIKECIIKQNVSIDEHSHCVPIVVKKNENKIYGNF